jgi:hypothetical protein
MELNAHEWVSGRVRSAAVNKVACSQDSERALHDAPSAAASSSPTGSSSGNRSLIAWITNHRTKFLSEDPFADAASRTFSATASGSENEYHRLIALPPLSLTAIATSPRLVFHVDERTVAPDGSPLNLRREVQRVLAPVSFGVGDGAFRLNRLSGFFSRRIEIHPAVPPSSTSRTFAANAEKLNGFWRKLIFRPCMPWRITSSSV